jgi:hypothetical protein
MEISSVAAKIGLWFLSGDSGPVAAGAALPPAGLC